MNTTLRCIWCGILSAALAVAAMGAESEQPPAKAVNTTCPVSGDPVDANAGTVTVHVSAFEPKRVDRVIAVGTCCVDCQTKVRAKPNMYGLAALNDVKAAKE